MGIIKFYIAIVATAAADAAPVVVVSAAATAFVPDLLILNNINLVFTSYIDWRKKVCYSYPHSSGHQAVCRSRDSGSDD